MTTMYQQQPGAAPQKPGGGAIVGGFPGGKKTGDDKKRVALVNISNQDCVPIGKKITKDKNLPPPAPSSSSDVAQITRPMTRSFRAKLLAQQQHSKKVDPLLAPTVPKPNKQIPTVPKPSKQIPIVSKPSKQIPTVPKPSKQIPIVPKPRKQIPTVPKPKVDEPKPSKQTVPEQKTQRNSKKKVHSLTSVLSARSLEASRSSSPITDIDRNDVNNQLAMVEYVEDIYLYYRQVEKEIKPSSDYMDLQSEITPKMRSILIDWLIEVHIKFELTTEALYLTIFLIDKYISTLSSDPYSSSILRRELQLVGISSMLIASKYEEIWAPEVNDFIIICDNVYSREQILKMEKEILEKIQWNVTVPTHFVFLNRFIKAAAADKETENMVFFLAELGMVHYEMLKYGPSLMAAAAVYAARCTLKKETTGFWDATLREHTGFNESEVIECARLLVVYHTSVKQGGNLTAVFDKYSSPRFNSVALFPAAETSCFLQNH